MKKSTLVKRVSETTLFSEYLSFVNNNNHVLVKESVGSLTSFAINELSKSFKNVLVITDTEENERFLKADLSVISGSKLISFPSTNHKPYDTGQIVDSGALVLRSEALEQIKGRAKKIVTASASAISEKVAPPHVLDKVSVSVSKGDTLDPENLKERLVDQGYNPTRFVDEPGDFAMRGGIFDIYPFAGEYPIRLEFFGDELESIREFDADSQRSVSFLNQAKFIPDLTNLPDSEKSGFLSYFDEDTALVLINPELISSTIEELFHQSDLAYKELEDPEISTTKELYLSESEYITEINKFKNQIRFGSSKEAASNKFYFRSKPQPDFHGNFELLRKEIEQQSQAGNHVLICCDNDGQKRRFEELLGERSKKFDYSLLIESLHEGFIYPDSGLCVYTDHQIFNRYYRPKVKRRKHQGGISFKELKDLNIGDFVVHVDYGIGTFAGFKNILVKETQQEVVVLRYKDDSVLYVNVSSLHKLQKYSGKEGTAPRITKLGSGEWARKKAQTKKKVKDIARELILLYAKRKSQKAHSFGEDTSWQTEMEANFQFEETPDQDIAIQAVKQDMESEQPMDRLVCGDVGFGKTEVAVRAAFKAVMDHKQVGVLVPTTILAEQHAKTFQKRMGKFPVSVEVLSRFRTKAEQTKVLKKLDAGEVDILIGTHRILSKDIKFKDLGLIVVDEEQRFGVSAKEKLKEYRAAVDVLTLTATPIPRTLQFSLMGARDLSIINTPPPNRQPVYTEIHSFDEELIKDAILQEMSRGGQVFFINNRVKNIEEVAEMIRRLVPDVRVRFGHGQMTGSQLEKIITDFYNHKFDVLVSTNIVENGIDIANANTIIINQADNFGLAELHQLRGRVGRSNRKAFCYLITRPIQTLTPEARKRLLALEEFSDLGSGFNIAMRDLDIRGAGNILGGEQSGFINDIGFELYSKILNDAVRELKESEFSHMFEGVEAEIELPETVVEFDESALLPNNYVSDNVERLNLYRKLSQAKSEKEIDDWREEIEDRFGPAPKAALYLIEASKIKLFASRCLFTKVTIRSQRMWAVCPKAESKLAEPFYEQGKFQSILKQLEALRPNKFQLIQKNEAVRLAIQDIPDIFGATEFLKGLSEKINA
ncbi:MAG: transcription-repair coupling factor [Bacteroidetes bacterium]|nr:transcription-repair coupling factor [Bacteroidota bacterium]|tara:strand:- start:196 stop:3525 length:3330 start_codon:yes stop_codon:yes gene_type:complete